MKDKLVFLIIGILIGAIITTAGFLIYNKTIAKNSNQPEMMQMDENGQMGGPKNGNMGEPGGNMPGQMGNNASSITYSASKEITEDTTIEDKEYSSETADENALLVNGDIDVTASNIEVSKTGDSDGGDNTSFYGINSAIIAKAKANLTLKNITVTTDRGWSKWCILLWWICYNK